MLKKHLTVKEFIWIALVFWAASFTAIEAPFSLAFKTKLQTWQILSDIFISILFTVDLYYHYKEREKLIKHHQKLKLKDKLMFAIDLFACIPFDLLAFLLGHNDFFHILRLFRLIRVIKIFYVIQNITIIPTIFRIQAISIFFFTVVNWIACGWILIYPLSSEYDIQSYYIRSFYWALTTLTTIGYGDITPKDNIGMIYTSFIMIIGVGMYGIVIGNITRMMAASDRHKEQSREKMNDLIMFMKYYNVPSHLQESAINHYTHLFSKRLSENDEKIIADLPHALQQEMQIYMKIKLIAAIPIFQNCGNDCLKEVAIALEQKYFSPNDRIINIGDIGNEMFIIATGSVDVILESNERVATLHDGQIFGEIALLKATKRTANVQSNSYCDLYLFTSEKFNSLIKKYPVLLKNIEAITNRRSQDRQS